MGRTVPGAFGTRTDLAPPTVARALMFLAAQPRGALMRNLFLSLGFLVACVGKAPPGGAGGGDDAPGDVDAPGATTNQRITGKTLDYFAAATPMVDATVRSDGIDPPKTATSTAGGAYAVDDVPPG